MSGKVYLVGAGPGAVDLLTLRAARLLGEADIVLHDALVSDEALALAPTARKLNVGKRAGRASADQAFINRLLVRAARHARVVVRLKGGDPMLFGRAQEEIDACRVAGVDVEVVPGVSAGFAAAAEALASLTRRGDARSVTFVTPAVGARESAGEGWADAAAAADVAVIYMGREQAPRVRDALLARGVPAARATLVVESASARDSRRVGGTLAELPALAAETGSGPALLLIGAPFARAAAESRAAMSTSAAGAA